MDMIKMIIFDCFGVIACEVAPQWLAKYFDEETAVKIKSEVIALADENKITDSELFERLGRLSGIPARQVLDEWMQIAKRRDDVVEYIISLRKRYTTALLSNAPQNLVQSIIPEEMLDAMFDHRVISCDVGMSKPHEDIYTYLLEKTGMEGSSCVFTDDNECNLVPARKLGIKTVLFKDLESLKAELGEMGIR